VQLEEPTKIRRARVEAAGRLPRRAAVTLFDSKTGATRMSRPSISTSEMVTAWRRYSTRAHPFGQPPITIEEVVQGRRHRQGRCGLAARDEAARP
jgi:primary-amine oxidase